MTVSTLTSENSYEANGVTTVFPYTFRVIAQTDLKVLSIDEDGETADITTGFTVSGVGTDAGGNVTFTTAPDDGLTIVVYRDMPYTQPTDYKNQGPFYGLTHERSYDRATLQIQQLQALLGRSLAFGPGGDAPAYLPYGDREGKFITFDADGNPIFTSGTGVDAGFRTDVAASGGSALVGFVQDGDGAVTRTVQSKLRDTVNVMDFGAVFDGTTDIGPAINLAIEYLFYELGGGTVQFPSGGECVIETKVLIPTGIFINLNGCSITGGGIGFATPMFETAYDNAGTLTSNTATSPETHTVLGAGVRGDGATINDAGTVFELFNFIDNCIVEGIRFNNCTINVHAERSFYCTLRRLFSRESAAATAQPAFWLDTFANIITTDSLYVVGRALAFKVSGGAYGLHLRGLAAESCTKGILITDTVHSLKLGAECYFEGCTTALEFSGVGSSFVGIDIDGAWFNNCTTALTAINITGRWGAANKLNDGANAVTLSDATALMKVEIPYRETATNGAASIPSQYSLGTKCEVIGVYGVYNTGSGNPTLKTRLASGVVPLSHYGDSGSPDTNSVGFHSHTKTAGTTFDVVVTTAITYRESAMVNYFLDITDNVGTYKMYGRVVAANVVKADDASGKTVTASNVGGFLVLTATSFSHPSSTYTCKGVVRHA